MNKKLIVALSKQLKMEESVLEAALLKEDGDESVLKPFTEKYNSYTVEDLQKLMQNNANAMLEELETGKKQLPQKLYDRVAAAALESREKKLAEQYGIKDYSDLQDLFNKAVESKAGKGADENAREQIETLKKNYTKLEADKNTEIQNIHSRYNDEFTTRDKKSALLALPLDYEDSALENQRKLLESSFGADHKLQFKEGKTIVLDREGKVITDQLGDPLPVSKVLTNHATQFGFKFKGEDPGGRGTGGSENKDHLNLKGVPFPEALAKAGLKANTEEGDKFYAEKWVPANKT